MDFLLVTTMSGLLVSILSGVVTALIIGVCAFLGKMNSGMNALNTSLAVIAEKVSHIDGKFQAQDREWERRFGELNQKITSVVEEVKELRDRFVDRGV